MAWSQNKVVFVGVDVHVLVVVPDPRPVFIVLAN